MSITLYDLMAEDHIIYAAKNKNNSDITIEVADCDGLPLYTESSHPAAWESLVYFAKQVLDVDKRLNQNESIE